MEKTALLSLEAYMSDEASSSDNEKGAQRKQAYSLYHSLDEVKKLANTSSFSFSLTSFLKEPFEESHLSDYELDKTDSVFSDLIDSKIDLDNNFVPNIQELVGTSHFSVSERDRSHSLRGCPIKMKEDSNNNLLPKTFEDDRSSESKLKKIRSVSKYNTKKEPIEVICLSDSELEQIDSPPEVNNQRDTRTCSFSLTPYFAEASFLSEFQPNKVDEPLGKNTQKLDLSEIGEQTLMLDPSECGEQKRFLDLSETGEHSQKLYHSETNLKMCSENVQSSPERIPFTDRKKKRKKKSKKDRENESEKKHKENFAKVATLSESSLNKDKQSLVSTDYSNISDGEELHKEGQCTTDDAKESLQAAKASCFKEFPHIFNVPVPPIPPPSFTEEDFSTPSSKSCYSKTKVGSASLSSHSVTEEGSSSPSSKRRHSGTKGNCSTPTPSLKRKRSMVENDDKAVSEKSVDLPQLDNLPFLSIPPPLSGDTSDSFSFFKKYPPPPIKRSYSMTEDESAAGSSYSSQKSTEHHKSYNNSSYDSPNIRSRRSFPNKHSSSFSESSSETPKRFYDDRSRRQSFPGKYSHQSNSRTCAADQTPYSPYNRHKRLRTELPYYNAESLLTFQSEDGFIDSHCHLDFLFQRLCYEGSYSDFQRENRYTFPECYKGCLAIFCNPYSFKKKRFWEDYLEEENVWASFGCHPHNARSYNDEIEASLLEALEHPKVRALGEIGLDYSQRNNCPKDIQQEAFRRQLKIALNKKLPLVIHCREAHEDGWAIMKEMVPKNYFIHLHCFTDTWDKASYWLQEFPNLYIGITNLVTFPSASEVHEVAKKIPLDRLLLETDSPYFVPNALMTRNRNERRFSHPGMAIHVAAQIAALKEGIPLSLVLHKTRLNTKKIYKI